MHAYNIVYPELILKSKVYYCFADSQVNKTEHFGTEGVTVTFQWPQDYPHNVSIVADLPIDSNGNNTSIILNVSYNAVYNVSITSLDPCGQNYFRELYYGKPVIMKVDCSPRIIFFFNQLCVQIH